MEGMAAFMQRLVMVYSLHKAYFWSGWTLRSTQAALLSCNKPKIDRDGLLTLKSTREGEGDTS